MTTTGVENYESFAKRYAETIENHPVRLYYERPAMLSLLGDVAGQRVLDAGCGSGYYSEWLWQQGAAVTAFDVIPDFVEMAKKRTDGRIPVHLADLAQPLTFAADASFDLVMSSLVMHYIADWGAVFREIYRILAPGGILIFSTTHPMTDLPENLNYFETQLYEMVWRNFGEPYPVLKVYHRPLSAMLNPLIAAGFQLEQVLEPLPSPEFQTTSPDEYEYFVQKPIFLYIRARRI